MMGSPLGFSIGRQAVSSSAAQLVDTTIFVGNNTDFGQAEIREKSCMICATKIPF